MDKVPLKAKLAIGFGALLLIFGVSALLTARGFRDLNTFSTKVDEGSQKLELARAIEAAAMKESSGIRGFLLFDQESMLDRLEEGKQEYRQSADGIREKLQTEESKRSFAEIERLHKSYVEYLDQEVALQRAGRAKEARKMLASRSTPVSVELGKATDQFVAHEQKAKQQVLDEQSATEFRAERLVLALPAIAILAGLLVATIISRSIHSAVGAMLTMAQQIAENDLAIDDLQIKSADEIGKAGMALNQMKNSLRDVIRSIAGTAEHVASASEQISASAAEQAKSAENQKDPDHPGCRRTATNDRDGAAGLGEFKRRRRCFKKSGRAGAGWRRHRRGDAFKNARHRRLGQQHGEKG